MKLSEYYDALSIKYDDLYNDYKIKMMRDIEKTIIQNEIDMDKDFVLDIGCGTGIYLKFINNSVGLDISYKMAEKSKLNTNKFVVVGSCEDLPFKKNTFDCIISFFGPLNHCQISRSLKEIRRVLKKNGKFIFTVANVYDIRWIIKTVFKKGYNYVKKSINQKKGEIIKYIGGKKIKVKTNFYSMDDIEKYIKKYNFKIKYTFGTNLTNTFLDRYLYKSMLKNFGWYIGAVCIK